MPRRFVILEHGSPARPEAGHIAFCDGTGGAIFRPGTDIELSHWRPNHTPAKYRAGTSTEVCFKFLDDPLPGDWTLAVNNHLDIDGILSIYVLVHSDAALEHRQTLIHAAEMGDFWGWGDPPAQRVFQGVTRLYMQGEEAGRDATSIYRDAFDLISELIAGTSDRARQIEAQLEPLRQNAAWLGSGAVSRRLIAGRLAHYIVPREIAGDDPARATHVPGFNEPISPAGLFWPHARARLDAQRACLVSIAAPAGWYHSLWAPGYLWADTEGLWQFPGLSFRESMSAYHLENPALERAVGELARLETAPGRWALKTAPPVGPGIEENFPMVLRFVTDEGEPIASQLAPDVVARTLNADGMFDAAH